MKMRFYAVILSCILALNVFAAGIIVFAEVDVTETETSNRAFEILGNLDISPFDDFSADSTLTRAEVVVLLMDFVTPNRNVIASTSNEIIFVDVSSSDWFARHAAHAVRLGYLAGEPDGRMRPHDTITLAEAATITVGVLGYRMNALSMGGFPIGFMATALRLGMLNDIPGFDETQVTQNMAAQIFFNMLDILIMEPRGFGGNIVSEPTVTFSERTFGLVHATGILQTFGKRRISGNLNATADTVTIDGFVYNKSGNDVEALLGHEMNFYFRVNRSGSNDFVFGKTSHRVTVLEIERRDFEGFANRVLTYRDERGRTRSANISGAAYIIFNGAPVVGEQFSADLYNDVIQGRYVLIDNNNDGIFDVVKITSEVNYIVSSVNDEDFYITDRYGLSRLSLDVRSENYTARIMDNQGNTMAIDRIAPLDVVTVIKSIDGDFVDVYVSKTSVIGTVTEMSVSDDETMVIINSEEYVFSPLLLQHMADSISVGLTSRFLLDFRGEIAYVDMSEVVDGLRFGYIIAFAANSGFNATLRVRIFDEDGRFNIFTVNDRCIIDGMHPNFSLVNDFQANRENRPGYTQPMLTQPLWGNGLEFRHQLVRFRLNSDGEVAEIDTIALNEGVDAGNQLRLSFVRGFEYTVSSDFPRRNIKHPSTNPDLLLFNSVGTSSLSGIISYTPTTRVFTIPSDPLNAPDSAFHVGVPTAPLNGMATLANGAWLHVDAFRVNYDTLFSDVIVKYANAAPRINVDSRIAVVDGFSAMLNDEGAPVTRLHAIGDGIPTRLFVSHYIDLNNVRVPAVRVPNINYQVNLQTTELVRGADARFPVENGDVVRLAWNSNNEIVDIEIIYKRSLNQMVPQNPITQNIVTQGVVQDGETVAFDSHHLYGSMIRPLPLRHRFIAFTATVAEKDGRTLRLEDNGEGVAGTFTLHATQSRIFVYDSRLRDAPRVRPGSVADIQDVRSYGTGSTVVVELISGTIRTVIVYL